MSRPAGAIEWTSDQIQYLQRRWNSNDKVSQIARDCTIVYGQTVTPNAVVGKVGRMRAKEPGWSSRPSPIRRRSSAGSLAATTPPPVSPDLRARSKTLPPLPSTLNPPVGFVDRPPPVILPPPASRVIAAADDQPLMRVRCDARSADQPIRRRDGSGCLFPIGEPGHRSFHYCDDGLSSQTAPYCEQHGRLCVVKLVKPRADPVAWRLDG